CFQVALKLNLTHAVPEQGISFSDFFKKFEQYDHASLNELMEFLHVRGFFRQEKAHWYPTPLLYALEEVKNEVLAEGLWKASYNMIDYLVQFPEKLKCLNVVQKSIDPNPHCLSLTSDESAALVLELSRGYLLTRALRQLTGLDCFEFLGKKAQTESTLM